MTATISTQGLTKRYGHATVLDSLDLEIEQGEVFGYLGPNGAGKSTTISLLLGLIHPTSGGARIFDLDVWRDARLVHERVAFVPSEANLWPSLNSVVLAGRRDVGAGALASRDVVRPRRFGPGSPWGLAVRLELPVLAAWCVGAASAGLAFGIIAKIAIGNIPSSISDTLDKFGVRGTFLHQYLGVAFLLIATVIALLPASQIGAAAEEETSGRLVHLLVGPVRRAPVLVHRLGLAAVGVVVAALAAGLGVWAGGEMQGVSMGLGTMTGAALNVVPTALLVVGIGAVVLASAPRLAGATVYAVVIWSVLVDLLGSMVSGLGGLDRLSLFHYMALAPAEDPDPTTVVVTILLAVALCVVATLVFDRRDVETG